MSWATKRQFAYMTIVIVIILLVIGIPVYLNFFRTAPTCSDGKQNGDETGIDCGGSCAAVCPSAALAPLVLWQRMSEVSPGFYNVLAYVQNSNANAGAYGVPYVFKLYDSSGLLVAERTGSAFLPPSQIIPIFESTLQTGNHTPVRVLFSFTGNPSWQKIDLSKKPQISVENKLLKNANTLPVVTADIINQGVETVDNIYVTAVAFDAQENAVAFSRTLIGELLKGQSKQAVFTWRQPFSASSTRIEIIPVVQF